VDLPQLFNLIRDVGFPIFVATYALVSINSQLKRCEERLARIEEKLDIPA
jgi:hypothetical protein